MNLTFRPETAKFIEEQMKTGRFATAEALIEAALTEFSESGASDLDAETVAAIHEGLDEADRGEGIELDAFRAQFFNRHNGNY